MNDDSILIGKFRHAVARDTYPVSFSVKDNDTEVYGFAKNVKAVLKFAKLGEFEEAVYYDGKIMRNVRINTPEVSHEGADVTPSPYYQNYVTFTIRSPRLMAEAVEFLEYHEIGSYNAAGINLEVSGSGEEIAIINNFIAMAAVYA